MAYEEAEVSMRFVFTLMTFLVLGPAAHAMTNEEITAKTISDRTFIRSVETRIRNTFREPSSVSLSFQSIQAEMERAPNFIATFKYVIQAGDVNMGLCTFTVQAAVQADSSMLLKKLMHEDCGD